VDFRYVNTKCFNDLVTIEYQGEKLFLVNRLIRKVVFANLKEEIKQLTKDENNWDKLTAQEEYNRLRLKDEKSSILKSILNEMNHPEYIEMINNAFGFNIKGVGCLVWLDQIGYEISLHVDNEKVKHSMQIYLGDEENVSLGTSFAYDLENGAFLTLPFKNNFGYVFKNTNKLTHGLLTSVPKDFKRYSLYFLMN
jgi:hypothetical protein